MGREKGHRRKRKPDHRGPPKAPSDLKCFSSVTGPDFSVQCLDVRERRFNFCIRLLDFLFPNRREEKTKNVELTARAPK